MFLDLCQQVEDPLFRTYKERSSDESFNENVDSEKPAKDAFKSLNGGYIFDVASLGNEGIPSLLHSQDF